MTMHSFDRRNPRFAPLFDVDPVTGASIEVFYADRTLEKFGRVGAGWFWWPRRRGFAPEGAARGPFPSSYSAYRNAVSSLRLVGEQGSARASFGQRTHARNIAALPYCFHEGRLWTQHSFDIQKSL